ncbi:hypothetical protein A2U01_0093926, partial [Trifolium medium]|nr:hypothetical protein [Trifolium medium]
MSASVTDTVYATGADSDTARAPVIAIELLQR